MNTLKLPVLSVLTALSFACAKQQTEGPVDTWIQFTPGVPALCLPAPTARLNKDERAVWTEMLEHATQGRATQARSSLATLEDASLQSPAAEILIIFQALSSDGPMGADVDPVATINTIVAAADQAPLSGCLQHTAGFVLLLEKQRDPLPYLRAAEKALPESPRPLAARLFHQQNLGQVDSAELAASAKRFPDDPTIQGLYAFYLLRKGRYDEAVAPLDAVQRATGDAGRLFEVTRLAGRLDRYLPMAAERGLPVGDKEALLRAEDPEAAFASWLGVQDGAPLLARLETSQGTLSCELLWKQAPVTVANFVGLARGTQPFTDSQTAQVTTRPYYDGTVFHRVIPQFMIQGGDPTGSGSGGPGYRFIDEPDPRISFDRPGLLAMANSGPGTNGSQFFITEAPVTYLNGKHTIFGRCDEDTLEVVKRIANVPRDAKDRPQEEVVLERIVIGDGD